jgi:hypothetical protein
MQPVLANSVISLNGWNMLKNLIFVLICFLPVSLAAQKQSLNLASMGAEVFIFATDELEISAGLGAVVDCIGSPSVRQTSSSLGAEIRVREN